MEYTPGDYPSDECYQGAHPDCGGYRPDTKNTIALAGGNVPSYMQMAPEGVVIVVSLCSCTCHDRQLMENDDLRYFLEGYQTSLAFWGFAVRVGSQREVEDKEQDIRVKEQLSNGKLLELSIAQSISATENRSKANSQKINVSESHPENQSTEYCSDGHPMRIRKNRKNPGESFWGCTQWPRCRNIKPM